MYDGADVSLSEWRQADPGSFLKLTCIRFPAYKKSADKQLRRGVLLGRRWASDG